MGGVKQMDFATNLKKANNFFNNNVRFEAIYHIGTMFSDDSINSSLEDAFNDDLEQIALSLGIDESILEEVVCEDSFPDQIFEFLCDRCKIGFLCKVATPKRTKLVTGSSTYDWAIYTTTYIYSESFEKICQLATEWAYSYITKP